MVYTYYGVGRYIVEDEQKGEKRAAYGKAILKNLSVRLLEKYGKGWSVATLKNAKQFYCVYSEKLNTVCPIEGEKAKHCLANSKEIKKSLSSLSETGVSIHTFTLRLTSYTCQTSLCCKPR